MEIGFMFLLAIAAYLVGRAVSAQQQADAVANFWRTLAVPPFIIQSFPGDRTAEARRLEFVSMLEKHENKFFKAGMPGCCYIHGDAIAKEATVGMTWAQFNLAAHADYIRQLSAWSDKVDAASRGAAVTHILNQVPVGTAIEF